MKKYIFLFLLAPFLFLSCNNPKKKEVKELYADCLNKYDATLTKLSEDATYALERMKETGGSKEQNNAWFDDFWKKKEKKFSNFCKNTSVYDLECSIDTEEWEELNKLEEDLLDKNNLRIAFYGGGDCQKVAYKKNYLYNLFKDYITEDYLLFCQIKDKAVFFRYRTMMGFDEELPEKMFLSEQFLKKYPRNNKFEEVKEDYLGDIDYFLSEGYHEFGKDEMKGFIENYPNTFVADIFSRYLKGESFEKRDKLPNLLNEELKKYDNLEFLFKQ